MARLCHKGKLSPMKSTGPDISTSPAKASEKNSAVSITEPKTLPISIQADLPDRQAGLPAGTAGGKVITLVTRFGTPQPSGKLMTQGELIRFFDAQKKGTPVRLTLRKGKVFVGRYSSYDAINEIVWFDTPSGVLLTTSSFGLKRIAHAEAVSPETDKKQAVSEHLN